MIHQHTYFTIITELELFTIICSQIHKTCPYRRISRIIELFHHIFSNTGRNCITRIPDFALYFIRCKNIVRYALETEDSIATTLEDCGDYFHFKLVINEDTQVEFFGKAYHMPPPPFYVEPTSIYELWIHKSNGLPYKKRRAMSHNISVETCCNVEINKETIDRFDVFDYVPQGYETKKYDYGVPSRNMAANLTGKKAPEWTLNDIKESPVSLSDLKSKVILVNITGIGCGACQASIPFLKELKRKYQEEDFELVAIESWSRMHSLQNYAKRKELNYMFLDGDDKVIEDYRTGGAAPYFFILDKERIIRKVIRGYGMGKTDKEITEAIEELL